MIKIILCLLLLLSCTANADLLGLSNPADMAGKQGTSVYTDVHYFAGDDYIAVNQFSDNWNGSFTPRNGTNLALLNARVEAGASYDSWRVAALFRDEILIESNRDLTEMMYYNKQHLTVPAGQSYNINLQVEGFMANGIRLDKGFDLPQIKGIELSAGAGISLLRGNSVRVGQVNGTAASTITGYNYNATVEENYSKASYPNLSDATPIGQGYALDVGAKAILANGVRLDVAANDLLGEMKWDNLPYINDTANSATLVRDPSGNISYNPIISGVDYRRSFTQKLDTKLHAQLTYPTSKIDYLAGTDWVKGNWLPQVGLVYHLNPSWKTTLDYDLRFSSVGLGIEHKWFYLNLRSDSVSLGNAKAYGLAGGVKVTF